jgi:hypothetical protein
MWYLYTVEFYSATKKNEILLFAGKWVELENIVLGEVGQVQKPLRLHVFCHIWNLDIIQIQAIL